MEGSGLLRAMRWLARFRASCQRARACYVFAPMGYSRRASEMAFAICVWTLRSRLHLNIAINASRSNGNLRKILWGAIFGELRGFVDWRKLVLVYGFAA